MNIKIDISSLIEPYSLSEQDVRDTVDYAIKELATRFANALEVEANNTLNKARLDYISNINVKDEGFAAASVVLTGDLANSIEQGKDAWDMKPFLLNGPNAKTGKDGKKYNTIPFTWGTPGTLSENFSGIMPKEVYEIAKSKKIAEGKNVSIGIKKDELPKSFQQPQVKSIQLPDKKSIVEYQHKHSIYEGIRKQRDHVTKQNRYMSFRRVSENSDQYAWWHPGFRSANLFDKAMQNFNPVQEIGKIVDEIFT